MIMKKVNCIAIGAMAGFLLPAVAHANGNGKSLTRL
jgi:hypothetical protein